MAERLRVSKGWLSKMLKVATIPDAIVAAFASPADVQLKPGYALAQAIDNRDAAKAVTRVAGQIAKEQAARREANIPSIPAADVLKRLLAAPAEGQTKSAIHTISSQLGRPLLTIQSSNRQGVTLRLHAGAGADTDEISQAVREALAHLEANGKGLQR
jgi:ParB family transcriptional regulator, chromosome partitioning protein